jgi:hypothetical protein
MNGAQQRGRTGKSEIRNQNGAKRHRPSIFPHNKTVKSEGFEADAFGQSSDYARFRQIKCFEFRISNFEFSHGARRGPL